MISQKLIMRESFNEQDVPNTNGKVTVQGRSSRSISVKDIRIAPVSPSVIKPIIINWHYLHSMPSAPKCCYGVYLDGELIGGAAFSIGPRFAHKMIYGAAPQNIAVLARL